MCLTGCHDFPHDCPFQFPYTAVSVRSLPPFGLKRVEGIGLIMFKKGCKNNCIFALNAKELLVAQLKSVALHISRVYDHF